MLYPDHVTSNQASSRAWVALFLGILGLALPLLSPAAVVLGSKALKQIGSGHAQAEGTTPARVGIVLGYLGSAWLAFCLFIAGIYVYGLLTGQYPPK